MSVRVETTGRAITASGGGELLREAARAVGPVAVTSPFAFRSGEVPPALKAPLVSVRAPPTFRVPLTV